MTDNHIPDDVTRHGRTMPVHENNAPDYFRALGRRKADAQVATGSAQIRAATCGTPDPARVATDEEIQDWNKRGSQYSHAECICLVSDILNRLTAEIAAREGWELEAVKWRERLYGEMSKLRPGQIIKRGSMRGKRQCIFCGVEFFLSRGGWSEPDEHTLDCAWGTAITLKRLASKSNSEATDGG